MLPHNERRSFSCVGPYAVPEDIPVKKKNPQLTLDEDYERFSFAPEKLLQSFGDDKMKNPKEQGPLNKGVIFVGLTIMWWPVERSRAIAGRLFVHMTNCVTCNHG